MNNSTVNFTSEASTNSPTQFDVLVDYLYIFMYSFGFFFGLPTHSYIIWLIITGAKSGVTLEFFILNLSVSECGYSVKCLAFVLSSWFQCLREFKHFLVGLVATGRPLFQCLICVERYLAVVHPVIFLKYKPLRYRLICCSAVWVIILASCLFNMFTMVSHNMLHIWFLSVQFLFFFSIQLFCLVSVLRALKQSGPGDRRREEENHVKRRAFLIIVITTVSMVITYVPYNCAGLVSIIRGKGRIADWLPGLFCYVLCGFVQPVLYLHRIGKISCCCFLNLLL